MPHVQQRRVKVVWIGQHLIEDILNLAAGATPDHFSLPNIYGLPEGWRVECVKHDWSRRAFGLLVAHPSFDPVPDGCEPPTIEPVGFIGYEMVEFERKGQRFRTVVQIGDREFQVRDGLLVKPVELAAEIFAKGTHREPTLTYRGVKVAVNKGGSFTALEDSDTVEIGCSLGPAIAAAHAALEKSGVGPIALDQAGVCARCRKPLADNEGVPTCDAYRHLTLCNECYKAAGSKVR